MATRVGAAARPMGLSSFLIRGKAFLSITFRQLAKHLQHPKGKMKFLEDRLGRLPRTPSVDIARAGGLEEWRGKERLE